MLQYLALSTKLPGLPAVGRDTGPAAPGHWALGLGDGISGLGNCNPMGSIN